MTNWINKNKKALVRTSFLIPILAVAAISISHVVSWYDLANPISWAIYLSIAVEIAAMSAIAASSIKVKGFSVWFVFVTVTLIQFIGNIYFSYSEIDINSIKFKDWADLTSPIFELFTDVEDLVAQRRLLALLEGGLLPLISLTCLHFFIKYGDIDQSTANEANLPKEEILEEVEEGEEKVDFEEKSDLVKTTQVSQAELLPDEIEKRNVKPNLTIQKQARNN